MSSIGKKHTNCMYTRIRYFRDDSINSKRRIPNDWLVGLLQTSSLLLELVEFHELVLDQDVVHLLLGAHRQPRGQCFQRGGNVPGEQLGGRLLSLVHQLLGGRRFVYHRWRRRRSLGRVGRRVVGVRWAVVELGGVVIGTSWTAALVTTVGVIDGLDIVKNKKNDRQY